MGVIYPYTDRSKRDITAIQTEKLKEVLPKIIAKLKEEVEQIKTGEALQLGAVNEVVQEIFQSAA